MPPKFVPLNLFMLKATIQPSLIWIYLELYFQVLGWRLWLIMEMAAICIGSNYGPVQEVDPDGDDGDNGKKSSLIGYLWLGLHEGWTLFGVGLVTHDIFLGQLLKQYLNSLIEPIPWVLPCGQTCQLFYCVSRLQDSKKLKSHQTSTSHWKINERQVSRIYTKGFSWKTNSMLLLDVLGWRTIVLVVFL